MAITICPKCYKLNKVSIEKTAEKDPVCGSCGSILNFQGGISNLSANELKNLVAKSNMPIVVDFWAPWCGPCKMFAPVFSEVAKELSEKIIFVKVNTDEEPMAGQIYNIRGIPTMIVFNNGLEKTRISGAMPADRFKHWLNEVIS